ncbi:hypothetical protein GUJ93_ZPchr0013g37596 [Zizania palustris]|nr:hypothetical protein GUJ93_ZPchr0013g37596 [Zizania palustris]
MQNNYQEYVNLKARVEVLQHSQRNLLGEDLAPLSTNELEQLESQLDRTLKQIRSRKTQVLVDELCDLKRKEQMLQDANSSLKRKLDEIDVVAAAPAPQPVCHDGYGNDGGGSGSGGGVVLSNQPPQPEHFFESLGATCLYTPRKLQTTALFPSNLLFHAVDVNQPPAPPPGGYLPAWMA